MTAREYAIRAHGNQRYGDQTYEAHLQAVVDVLTRFAVITPILESAAWLHDVLEDTGTVAKEIWGGFGANVAMIVFAVTNEGGANRKERAARTYPKIRQHGADAVILKMADRIANTEHSIARGTRHLEMYRREFPEFEAALYRAGECDAMWDHLRAISKERTVTRRRLVTNEVPELAKEIAEREAAHKKDMEPTLNPSLSLLVKLGSIIVHAEEALSPDGHRFDHIALRGLMEDPEVAAWLDGMRKAAFLPVKRKERP